ncbi:c-14 sterol reductase [Akanthomyces lecanii RCEF 1005]|uniref:Delta(14)-sterol reductase n=1 Tax=Akanthomyces lecanii RCEF 1005 TaxID=1081108 RepID=A0A168FL41_CORDF|nr:c-14 sterol reductase [Akanthomyces lecanii RCEF 1005]
MAPSAKKIEYEFGGPLGAAGIVFGLPVLVYAFFFACNDTSGCPAPGLLSPRNLTWDALKTQIPWPEDGLAGFITLEAAGWTFAYYLLSLVLFRVLPSQKVLGAKLRESGRPLDYSFNAFSSTLVQVTACAVGTYVYGADFVVWRWIDKNYLQLLTANVLLSWFISIYVYAASFTVKTGNSQLRELAKGGHTGSLIYDFYIGRELNPRITLPIFGEIDIKTWLEMRPGLTGWLLLDLAFMAKQYRNYGYVTDSMVFVTAIQGYYVLEGQYAEAGILSMMDIITDGLGFMLTFGDIVWVPFIYSTQCRYLAVYPTHLGWPGVAALSGVFAIGLYIFRASNTQKAVFRKAPDHPSVAGLSHLQTKRGTRLLTSGWWGVSRHINYFGDWMQSLPFSLAAGLAGYVILPSGAMAAADVLGYRMADGTEVVQSIAKGWGVIFTAFHALYFAVLLIHREGRDDAACAEKYGPDWEKYKSVVRWKILPGVY